MHDASYKKMRAFAEVYLRDVRESRIDILDVGSQSIQGMQTYRPLFGRRGWHYRGLDVSEGENVDVVVADPYHWTGIPDASIDAIVSGQALEHIEFPWLTLSEIARVLKPGGLACLIAPSSGPEHLHPVDCWRFLPDGMKALASFAGLHIVEVFADWGILPWQDTFAVMQKPHSGISGDSPIPVCNNRNAAMGVYGKAIEARPKNALYYQKLAAYLTADGDTRSAAAVLRIGVEQVPGSQDLRVEAIRHLLRGGNVTAAMEQAVGLLGLRPVTPLGVNAAGEAFSALDAQNREFYAALLPSDRQALQRVAELADAGGLFELSFACWVRLADADPLDLGKGLRSALAQFGKGDREAALARFGELRRRQIEAGEINRTTVLQRLIDATGAHTYLEIGVEFGINFFQIEAPVKLAVDPRLRIPGGAVDFEGTRFFGARSDDFFSDPPQDLLRDGVDIALVDGLHSYEQSLRDVENCLRFLNPGGVIVMHDCRPSSEAEACPSIEEARMHPEFRIQWTGDVYRTIAHLRAFHPDLRVAVIDADHGIGIIERGEPETSLKLTIGDIRKIGYHELVANAGSLLNLKPPEWFNAWLENRLRS